MLDSYHKGEDIFESLFGSLQEWEAGFYRQWSMPEDLSELTYVEREEFAYAIEKLRSRCLLSPAIYKMIVQQEIAEVLRDALSENAHARPEISGFDLGQWMLVQEDRELRQLLDLELIRDVLAQIVSRPDHDRLRVYQLLAIAAKPEAMSVPARWYFMRAARLLLQGLDVECVIVCRAVLETALISALNPEKRRTLSALISDARKCDLLSDDEVARANRVKKSGDRFVHYDNAAAWDEAKREMDAPARVADLAVLLRRLLPSS